MSNRPHPEADPAEVPKAQRVRWWIVAVLSGTIAVAFTVVPYLPFAQRWPVSWTVVQPAALGITVIFTLYFIGKARLERAAYHADRIDIQSFTDERDSADRVTHSATELTARFKFVLNNSRLYTPTPVPGISGSYDFVQIVGNAGEAAEGWWRVATRLVKLAQPPAAFRINGTIRHGGQHGRYQLILELVRVPRFAASPIIIEDDDWSRVLHKAANAVAALVLPRSRFGANIHWASWRNSKIPLGLFDAYQRANYLCKHRRYDEALHEYHRALSYDPSNVYIRLEIGSLLEQLDLHMDALATYDDVVTICARGHQKLAKWWRIGPSVGRQPRRERRQRDVALFLARYRHALVLGHGDAVASTWWVRLPKPAINPDADARVRRRAELRTTLAVRFRRYPSLRIDTNHLTAHHKLLDPHAPELVRSDPATQQQVKESDERAAELRAYLCALSQFEIERLLTDFRRFRRQHFFRARRLTTVLSTNALRLCLVWIVLRRAMANVSQEGGGVPDPRPADLDARRKPVLHNVFPNKAWPPDPDELDRAIRTAGGHSQHPRSWSECYNAACDYAVALLDVGPRGQPDVLRQYQLSVANRDKVATLAVAELYHATSVSHTGRLAGRRAWLMDEDPDLGALRGHEQFRVFETVTFSPDRPATVRPLRAHVWEQVSFVRSLVGDLARCRAEFWRSKVAGKPAAEEFAGWRQDDQQTWCQLHDLAVSRQDWYTRHEAISLLRRWAKHHHRPTSMSGFPTYSDDLLSTQYSGYHGAPAPAGMPVTTIAARYVGNCDERLDQLVEDLTRVLRPPSAAAPASPHTLSRRCTQRADLWAALAAWFDDRTPGTRPAGDRRKDFQSLSPAALT